MPYDYIGEPLEPGDLTVAFGGDGGPGAGGGGDWMPPLTVDNRRESGAGDPVNSGKADDGHGCMCRDNNPSLLNGNLGHHDATLGENVIISDFGNGGDNARGVMHGLRDSFQEWCLGSEWQEIKENNKYIADIEAAMERVQSRLDEFAEAEADAAESYVAAASRAEELDRTIAKTIQVSDSYQAPVFDDSGQFIGKAYVSVTKTVANPEREAVGEAQVLANAREEDLKAATAKTVAEEESLEKMRGMLRKALDENDRLRGACESNLASKIWWAEAVRDELIFTAVAVATGGVLVRVSLAAKAKLAQRAAAAAKNSCFESGTPVFIDRGLIAIEDVRIGDRVWSWCEATGEWSWQEVVRLFRTEYSGKMVKITFGADDIRATGSHPVWVVDGCSLASRPAVHELPTAASRTTASGRWAEARHLRAGDTLQRGCGSTTTLASVASRRETAKWVYNLEVSRTHTYTVGTSTVLVHNACVGGAGSLGSAVNLNRTLRAQEMIGEMQAGARKVIASGAEIRDVNRLVSTYGGTVDDWVKVSSTRSASVPTGRMVGETAESQVHGYMRKGSNQIYDAKFKD